jgi:hypothetical protein
MTNFGNLPGAIIIGAQKCGTTTLHYSLVRHSGINGPKDPHNGTSIKEINFFYSQHKWNKGIEWYSRHFAEGDGLCLDSSPNYLTVPDCYRRIHEMLPEVKLILCIRNPVLRAYSQYNHYKQVLPQSESWDWACDKDFLTNLQLEWRSKPDLKTNFIGLLAKGVYVNQIDLLLQYFKRDQLYISVMEWWRKGYQDELGRILTFLGLEKEVLSDVIAHQRKYTVELMEPAARELLFEFYRPYNERLFDLLGFRIPEWEQTSYGTTGG